MENLKKLKIQIFLGLFRNILADSRLRAHRVLWNQQMSTNHQSGSGKLISSGVYTIDSYSQTEEEYFYARTTLTSSQNGLRLLFVGSVNGSYTESKSSPTAYTEPTATSIYRKLAGYNGTFRVRLTGTSGDTGTWSNLILVNVTQMFGAGNEPTDIEEVELIFSQLWADNPSGIYTYNPNGTVMWYYA